MSKKLVETSVRNGICTIQFCRPDKLNSWTQPMVLAKRAALQEAQQRDDVKAVVLTGSGKYYCAGVDLAAILKPMSPKKLVAMITKLNEELFDTFLSYEKPIFVAANGPAIGAAATSATLTDGIVANSAATFQTPFAALGLVPEGCSSVIFEEVLGVDLANKMLNENYKLTAEEALKHKFILDMTHSKASKQDADDKLLEATWVHVENYLQKNGMKRSMSAEKIARLQDVNRKESFALANAFMSESFLRAMEANAARKGRNQGVMMFKSLRLSRPLWSLFL